MGGKGSGRRPVELTDLGEYCDEAVAAINDVSRSTVIRRRHQLGIPPAYEEHRQQWRESRECDEWTPPIEQIPG